MTNDLHSNFLSKSLAFCKDEVALSDVIECINAMSEDETTNESIVADLLWFIDTLISENSNEKSKLNFIHIVKACEKALHINPAFFKDRLTDDVLESLRLVNSKQVYNARYVKTKTRVFYKQNKFNLIREANEGFSKLLVELVTFNEEPELMTERIKSLIGYFDLDPNRVIDLILDVMELKIHQSEKFIKLLRLLKTDRQDMSDLIGHKLSMCVAESIFQLIVVLVQNDLIDLSSIFEHLSPSDEEIKEIHENELNQARTKRMVLSKLKEDDKGDIEEIIIVDNGENYQKVQLCYYFLKSGDWSNAKTIIEWLPPYFVFRFNPLTQLICDCLNSIIEPLYSSCLTLPHILTERRVVPCVELRGDFKCIANKFDDFNNLVFEVTNYLGPLLSTDKILYTKLIRICQAYFLEIKPTINTMIVTETFNGFYNLMYNCLIPSLSLLSGEIPLAEEIWDAIKHLPFDMRYTLYIPWSEIGGNENYHELICHKRLVQQNVKYILKRLSKENVKQYGRQLGKLCHCNPGIVFSDILDTIIMFSNQVTPIADTFKYLGNLSLDVLMFSIISTLATKKISLDDIQLNQKIQIISTFCGLLCKRYQFDLVGLFHFILNKIKDGQCAELFLVKEIIHKMTGIEVSEDMTDEQMDAMSGGELLRQEAGYFIQIRNVRKNSARLKEVLIEHNLAIPYVIILSQERNLLVRKAENHHLKIIGRLYDECQDTMLQMISFFSFHWSASEMVLNCPNLSELLRIYKVSPDVAFCLNRTHFNYKVQERFEERLENADDLTETQELNLYHLASQEIVDEYIDCVIPNFQQEIWDDFNSAFYTIFWLLQISDLKVPINAYKRQEVNIKAQIQSIENDNSMNSVKKQKEIDRFNVLLEKMCEEHKRCEHHVKQVDNWLNAVKHKWFIKNKNGPARSVVMTRFIELCVFPRVCFSSNDALFVAEMIYKLHKMKTPSFSTLICLDRIFNDITLMISTCSENEAKRYGRFLDAILNIIMRWHSSPELYAQECIAHPGFVTVFRKNTDGNNKPDQLTYENFRHVLHKWHYRVTKSVVSCLESDNYVQIRNALIVLEKVLNHYPKVQQFGQAIERRVDSLKDKEKDKRPDLHILTQSYHGHLIGKKSQWLQDKDFHSKEETKKISIKASDKNCMNGTTEKDNATGAIKKETINKRAVEDDKDATDVKKRRLDSVETNIKSDSPRLKGQNSNKITTSGSQLRTSQDNRRSSSSSSAAKGRSVIDRAKASPIMSQLQAQKNSKRSVLSRNKDI